MTLRARFKIVKPIGMLEQGRSSPDILMSAVLGETITKKEKKKKVPVFGKLSKD